MKVILMQEVKKLGKKGDIIEAAEGYARNFLLPKKYAVEATATHLNAVTQQKKSEERKQQQAVDEATLMAAQLSKIEVTIAVKTGEGGKLFGSVTGKDIAEALKTHHQLDIDRRKIEVKDGIKGIGDYEAVIKVHPEITSKIKVHIIAG